MASTEPPAAPAGLELLLERLRTGLGAERAELEADAPDTAPADDHELRSPVALADGRTGTLVVRRGRDAPAFDAPERQLFEQLTAITATVLRVAGEASQRTHWLSVTQAVSTAVSEAGSAIEALAEAVDAVFEHSAYYAVTATLIDRDTPEQLIVADRSHALRNHTGMRRPIDAGLIGAVARSGQQRLLGRAGDDPEFEWPGEVSYNSLLLTPVMVEGRCEAVLELCDTRANAFTPADAELLASVANVLSGALSKARALEESAHRAARLAVGSAVAAALTDARTQSDALELAARTVYENSHYHLVAATLVLDESREQLLVADLARDGSEPEHSRRPLDAGIVGAALTSREQLLLGDARADPRFDWENPLALDSLLVTPVVVDDRAVAALEVWDAHTNALDRFDAALMQHVADHLAAAWRSISLREESERRAQRLELSLEVTRSVASATSPEGALTAAVDALVRSTAFHSIAAVLADRTSGEQMLVAGHIPGETLPIGLRRPLDDGITGHVLEHGRPVRIDSPADAAQRLPWSNEPDFNSLLVMPVVVDGRCMATLELGDERDSRFSDQDMVLMATAAEQVAEALRRIRLRKESARRADRLALAADVARAIAGAGTVEELLDLAAQTVFERAGYSSTVAMLVLPESAEQLMVSDYRTDDTSLAGMRRPLADGLFGEVLETGEPMLLGRASEHARYAWPSERVWESMVAVPVLVDGRCRAILSAAERDPDRLDASDLSLMVAVAGQVAASLRGVELRTQSERRARRLALTSRIARSIAAAASVDEALEIAAATIFEATEYETVSVIRFAPVRGEASMTVCFDRGQPAIEPDSWPIDAGITGRTYRTGRVVRLGRATHDPDYAWIGPRPFDSLIQAPVMVDDSCVAILELADSPADRYNEDDEALVRTAAEQVAAAIRGVQLRADAEASAQRMQRALEAAKAVAAARSAQDVLETFVQTVYEGVGYAAVEASVPVWSTGEQVVVASVSRVTGSYTGIRRPIESGVTGIAFRESRQVHVRDTHAEMVPGMISPETWRSRMATPVIVDDQVVAVLGISDLEPDRYGETDHVFMRTVAEQVAAALLGARLRDESEARARRLAVSVAVAGAVAEAATVEETLRAAARALSEQIGCGAVTAYLADEQAGDQVALVDFDRHGVNVEGMRRPAGLGTTGGVFESGRQVRIDGITPGQQLVPWLATGTVYRSALVTPVSMQGRVAAAIGLYDLEPDRFDRQDEMLLQGVAEQVATAISGARLREELRQRADRLERLEQRHRALLERMVLAQEQERSRVAADLHDDTVQVLSACVISLDRVRRLLEEGEVERAATTLADVSDLISGAVDRTRRMTFELRPAVLWHNGLEAAVRQLIDTVAEESGLEITLESDMQERLDATLETIAFRSIAELIGNARNHSRGSRLDIRLSTAGGQLHAEVSDDGRGFDLEQALARARVTNHLGLEAVIERIDAAGGSVDITSAPGQGTTARLSLPVRPAV